MFKIAPPWSLHRGAFITCRPLGGACPVGAAQRAHPPRRPSGAAPSCPLMMGYGSRGTCSGGKAGSPPRPPERGARPPRRGAEAEAGRAGRRAAARQAGRGGARRQTGSAAAKIFGDIRCVRGRKNIRGHLTSGKPPEKARVRKRPCVFRDRGSPRWRAGCRGGAATPERPDRPRYKPYTAGYRLRGLASADCASRFGGRRPPLRHAPSSRARPLRPYALVKGSPRGLGVRASLPFSAPTPRPPSGRWERT